MVMLLFFYVVVDAVHIVVFVVVNVGGVAIAIAVVVVSVVVKTQKYLDKKT